MSSSAASTTDPTSTRVPEHDGPLYVTRRCFGMETCRNITPELFGEVPTESNIAPVGASVLPGSFETGSHTGVLSQPQDANDFADAMDAADLEVPFSILSVADLIKIHFVEISIITIFRK